MKPGVPADAHNITRAEPRRGAKTYQADDRSITTTGRSARPSRPMWFAVSGQAQRIRQLGASAKSDRDALMRPPSGGCEVSLCALTGVRHRVGAARNGFHGGCRLDPRTRRWHRRDPRQDSRRARARCSTHVKGFDGLADGRVLAESDAAPSR